MIGTEEHFVIVATRNHVVIDVYDIGCSIPSGAEMMKLEELAAKKGLFLQIIEVNGSEEMSYKDVAEALSKIERAVA